MLDVANPSLFFNALLCLQQHKASIGRSFKGRFIQIFLGMKFFQNNIPSMYSGSFITTEALQSLLDDLFSKASRPANNCVLSLFEGGFLARTGLIGVGNTTPQNTWRNNFNLQKGVGCYASAADLSSLTFLNQPRVQCQYLRNSVVQSLAGARCSLCLSGAEYRSEAHRKWLKIDPGGNGYASIDIQNISNFLPYVAPGGVRIPIFPLIIALYHDADPGLVIGNRAMVSVADFAADFNFSPQEISAYFDLSVLHPLNAPFVNSSIGVSAGNVAAVSSVVGMLPAATPMQPIIGGTPVPPPLVNSGWDAEQYVANALVGAGWNIHVVSRQQLGYDIFAQQGVRRKYVEVKSSLGLCSPSLTAREWQQANYYGANYILAILENFSPIGGNYVHWIPDPARRCSSTLQATVSHGVPRSSWVAATVPIQAI